ncbi:MAG: hypothetical protein IKE02_03735 [Lachnospiraceae bacterium]|nr:hypothetical protein [Lachnospiraceae bacterium]
MKIKLKAPEGYTVHDSVTEKDYSEVVIDDKERDRFELVADTSEPTIEQ